MTHTIPWWVPQMTGGEMEMIRAVVDSNYLNEGEVTERFEAAVATRVGCRHAIAVTSGTIAIFAALVGVGVRRGDEVIVPDLTFIATANAVTLAGATPVLVDVDEDLLTIDPSAVDAAVTPRTRAILPVHVSGRAADMDAIGAIARRHGLAVVEDAAEAFVSRHRGRALGTIGDAGCLSFSPNKSITTGQGGMVITNDDAVAGAVRQLKNQGRPTRGTGGDDVHPTLGFNFKLTNLQSAVGLAQLTRLDERLERQRAVHRTYRRRLQGLDGIRLPRFDLQSGETPLWTDAIVARRNELDAHLREHRMHCRRFWFPLHTQAPYRGDGAGLEGATAAAAKALWLPSAFTLSDPDVESVCDQIVAFITGR